MKRLIKGNPESVDKYINVTGIEGKEIGLSDYENEIYESKECLCLYRGYGFDSDRIFLADRDDCIIAEGIDEIKEYLSDLDLSKKC